MWSVLSPMRFRILAGTKRVAVNALHRDPPEPGQVKSAVRPVLTARSKFDPALRSETSTQAQAGAQGKGDLSLAMQYDRTAALHRPDLGQFMHVGTFHHGIPVHAVGRIEPHLMCLQLPARRTKG